MRGSGGGCVMATAWGHSFCKLAQGRVRGVDNLQNERKHDPLDQGQGVRGWCKRESLLDQVGVQLGKELNPGDFVTLTSLLGEEGKRKDVGAVDKPACTENVEDVENAVDVSGGQGRCLGDARSSPALGVFAYGGTRRESRGGREGSHLQHTRWWW